MGLNSDALAHSLSRTHTQASPMGLLSGPGFHRHPPQRIRRPHRPTYLDLVIRSPLLAHVHVRAFSLVHMSCLVTTHLGSHAPYAYTPDPHVHVAVWVSFDTICDAPCSDRLRPTPILGKPGTRNNCLCFRPHVKRLTRVITSGSIWLFTFVLLCSNE